MSRYLSCRVQKTRLLTSWEDIIVPTLRCSNANMYPKKPAATSIAIPATMKNSTYWSIAQKNIKDTIWTKLFTKRKTTSILISTIIEVELDLPDSLVSSVYDQQGATATNVNHIKVIRKFCIFTWSINMTPSTAQSPSCNCCNTCRQKFQPCQKQIEIHNCNTKTKNSFTVIFLLTRKSYIAYTSFTYLPDSHIHSVCNINISSVINCKPLWVVHPRFSSSPIYMSRITFRGSCDQLRSAVCSFPMYL